MFQHSSEGYFDIWEAKRDGSGYQEGVINANNVNIEQINECKNYNVNPIFPNFSQKVAILNGVLEGNTIEAVRYPSPEHMTGWWLTTDLYNGDVDTLSVVHFYHIAFERPELLKYLALPFGYSL